MKNKYVDLMLILILLVLFFTYFYYRSIIYRNTIPNNMDMLEKYTKEKQWDKAQKYQQNLRQSWEKFRFLLLLNYATEEYLTFYNYLDQISAGIEAKDEALVLSSVKITKKLWHNFTKIVPEP